MQQRWWLIAVAVVGIGLAVLLIPRPDTGEIPEPPPEVAPVVVKPRPARPDIIPGPPPGAEKAIAQRNRPSAKTARELAAPMGGIRFKLKRHGEEGRALSDRVGEVQQKLADHTSDVEGDLNAIIEEFAPILEELKANYGDDTDISKGIARYEAGIEQWNSEE